jgi:hypothetical protein
MKSTATLTFQWWMSIKWSWSRGLVRLKKRTPRCVPSCMGNSSLHCRNTKTRKLIVSAGERRWHTVRLVWQYSLCVVGQAWQHRCERRAGAFTHVWCAEQDSPQGRFPLHVPNYQWWRRSEGCSEKTARMHRERHSGSIPRCELHGIQGRAKNSFGRCATPKLWRWFRASSKFSYKSRDVAVVSKYFVYHLQSYKCTYVGVPILWEEPDTEKVYMVVSQAKGKRSAKLPNSVFSKIWFQQLFAYYLNEVVA